LPHLIYRAWLYFPLLLLSPLSANADVVFPLTSLADDPTWLKLVHYEPDSSRAWRSTIHSGDFFLAADGRVNPLSELQATLAAFAEPAPPDPNQHAQCRFPARLQWLKTKLGEDHPFPSDIKCPALDAWTQGDSVSSLSIIYAAGYLGNPASYYGHTLLKFNFKENNTHTSLMDVSVNYGAILEGKSKQDSQLSYLVKSVLGGYDGGFSHIHFYYFNNNYGEIELRDLWEYQLALPPEAVKLIVAHTWEVLGKRYTYYFFRRNCAYRMAEILQVVNGLKIIPDSPPWIIPQSVVRTLARATFQDHPLLEKAVYHPSRQSRFYEKFLDMPPRESDIFKGLAKKTYTFDSLSFQALPTASKQRILDALLDYYQFAGKSPGIAADSVKQDYARSLSARYQLPAGEIAVRPLKPISPQEGRPSGWIQSGISHNSANGDALTIRIRPAYYDALDADGGHAPHSALSMGDTQLNLKQGSVYLDHFTLLGIDSVNLGLSGLPGDSGAAWRLKVGAEQLRLSCEDCLGVRAQIDTGLGQQLRSGIFGAMFIGGALQDNRANQGLGYAKASAMLSVTSGDQLGMRLSYEYRVPVHSKQKNYGVMDAELRWATGFNRDFRISYARDQAQRLSLGLGLYW
jgi:hypothetical protein